MNTDLYSLLIETGNREGFPLAGAVDIDLARVWFEKHFERFERWLGAGFSGEMTYLHRGQDRRRNPRLLLPGAQSIFCVAVPYSASPAGHRESSSGPRYARYLKGGDYHAEIAARMERLMESVNSSWLEMGNQPLKWKICVDTSAILERSWAALAGLGWIGKNTLLIHPKLGSYLFLAEALLDQKTGQPPQLFPNYCGNCRRCLDVCPTRAFPEAGTLDANRCLSYWTLEKRGELDLKDADRRAVGPWVAGCDVCQEVCPFNGKPARCLGPEPERTFDATQLDTWKELLDETPASYRERVQNSATKRVKPEQFSRNLALTLSNAILSADSKDQLDLFKNLRKGIKARIIGENDPAARYEWIRCSLLLDGEVPA